MRKRVTAQDVADAAGVSKWTVIRAFTPGASIADASRETVRRAAEKLNYTPNLLARSLATSLTHQIAVCIDDFANPHKLPFLEQLTEKLQSDGIVVMLININRHFGHVHALLTADQRQVDAVVLLGTAFRDEILENNRSRPGAPPMFVLARDSQVDGIPAITCDVDLAMEEICRYLGSKNYRRPGFMPGPQTLSTGLGRGRLFRDYWLEHGVAEVPELQAHRYSTEAGAAAMRAYFGSTPSGQRIDLLMCENDVLAMGAMDVIRGELGLKIPDDIAVVGFDNAPFSGSPSYDLTTYEQPIQEIVQAVSDIITNKRESKSLYFRGNLIIRGSA